MDFDIRSRGIALLHHEGEGALEAVDRLVYQVIRVALECHVKLSLTEDAKHADHLQVVCDVSDKIALMGHLNAIVRVDDAGTENKARSCLANAHLAAICHFLNQFQEVHFKGHQTWVGVLSPDVLDDNLSSTKER